MYIASSTPNKGSYAWKVPEFSGSNFKIIVNIGLMSDHSDNFFSIAQKVNKNSLPKIIGLPAIPADLKVGQVVDFGWTATDADKDDLAWNIDWDDGTGIAIDCESIHLQNKKNWEFYAPHAWEKKGIYKVVARVKDCRFGEDESISTVGVEN